MRGGEKEGRDNKETCERRGEQWRAPARGSVPIVPRPSIRLHVRSHLDHLLFFNNFDGTNLSRHDVTTLFDHGKVALAQWSARNDFIT